jgi:hypothetical protein
MYLGRLWINSSTQPFRQLQFQALTRLALKLSRSAKKAQQKIFVSLFLSVTIHSFSIPSKCQLMLKFLIQKFSWINFSAMLLLSEILSYHLFVTKNCLLGKCSIGIDESVSLPSSFVLFLHIYAHEDSEASDIMTIVSIGIFSVKLNLPKIKKTK